MVSHFTEAPLLLAVAETGSFPCFHTVGSTTLPSSDGRLRCPGDPGASIVSSNLTICATASNFHRAVLRRRPGRELRSHQFPSCEREWNIAFARARRCRQIPEFSCRFSFRARTDSEQRCRNGVAPLNPWSPHPYAARIRKTLTELQAFLSRSRSRIGSNY